MKTTINERFNELIKAQNMNVNSFAKSIDKAYTTIEAICKSKTRPSYELLETIFITYPQISRDWLLMGEGDMFRTSKKAQEASNEDQYLKDHLKALEDKFEKLLAQKDSVIEGLQSIISYQREQLGKPRTVFVLPGIVPFFLKARVQFRVQSNSIHC